MDELQVIFSLALKEMHNYNAGRYTRDNTISWARVAGAVLQTPSSFID